MVVIDNEYVWELINNDLIIDSVCRNMNMIVLDGVMKWKNDMKMEYNKYE